MVSPLASLLSCWWGSVYEPFRSWNGTGNSDDNRSCYAPVCWIRSLRFLSYVGVIMVEIVVYALALIGVVALPALFFWSATTFDIREIGKSHEKENK